MRNRRLRHFLILLLALCLTLGCSPAAPESAETSPDSAEPVALPEDDPGVIAVIADGATAYTLIRSDTAPDDELDAAKTVFNGILERYGFRIPFETDFTRAEDDPDAVRPTEICVGTVNRSIAQSTKAQLSAGQFAIACEEQRIEILGSTSALTRIAAETFVRECLKDDGFVIRTGEIMIYEAKPTYAQIPYQNPVCASGADPWVVRDPATGAYYYCYSGGNGVCVNEIADLAHITSEGGRKVYTAPEGTMYSREYWAPELHYLAGKWYIYVAADDGNNDNHRMYVLECTGDKPTDNFKMVGKIGDPSDKWAIDGTVAQIDGELYFVWSGWAGDVNVAQNLYIAHMKSPTEIDSERTLISKPQYRWEKLGGMPTINEGPAALSKDGTVHIIYSASGSWSDFYNLGKVTWRGGDPLDAANWTKSEVSVFEKTAACFGPGHCSFVTADDGSTWIVYHGNRVSGSGWGGRSVWTQAIEWDGDEPVFGSPVGPNVPLTFPVAEYSADAVERIN